jgi:DNA modification methylase
VSPTAIRRRNLHPFPARMAPDLALEKIDALTSAGQTVLDPMCGSGTVPQIAVEGGRRAIACDVDPLAVIMTRTACNPKWCFDLRRRAQMLIDEAKKYSDSPPSWIACDDETAAFVEYWFAPTQRAALCRISKALMNRPRSDDPLRVALSRLIVTKDAGASLARDTSHSRPHRVRLTNDFDVMSEFVAVATDIESFPLRFIARGKASIRNADARALGFIRPDSVDLIVTSPPYLNAIDYLRGHRMTLVWLGWNIEELRTIRAESIGTERGLSHDSSRALTIAQRSVAHLSELRTRERRLIFRFTRDVDRLCASLARVIKASGHMVFVVADSQLRGVPVSNSEICRTAAEGWGFRMVEEARRTLPPQHRYLPPPDEGHGSLNVRMKEERVLTFRAS